MLHMQPPATAQTAISQTLFWTINHNLPVMTYVFGAVLMVALLLFRPRRVFILFLLGFILLAFNFEYVKHIQDALLEQTQSAVASTGYQSAKGQKIMDRFFNDVVPFGTYVFGWILIFFGIVASNLSLKELRKTKEPTT